MDMILSVNMSIRCVSKFQTHTLFPLVAQGRVLFFYLNRSANSQQGIMNTIFPIPSTWMMNPWNRGVLLVFFLFPIMWKQLVSTRLSHLHDEASPQIQPKARKYCPKLPWAIYSARKSYILFTPDTISGAHHYNLPN